MWTWERTEPQPQFEPRPLCGTPFFSFSFYVGSVYPFLAHVKFLILQQKKMLLCTAPPAKRSFSRLSSCDGLWTFAMFFFFCLIPEEEGERLGNLYPWLFPKSFTRHSQSYQVQNQNWMLFVLIGDHLQSGWKRERKKTSFAKSKSYEPPAGVVRGRLVGIVAAYVWCQEHH